MPEVSCSSNALPAPVRGVEHQCPTGRPAGPPVGEKGRVARQPTSPCAAAGRHCCCRVRTILVTGARCPGARSGPCGALPRGCQHLPGESGCATGPGTPARWRRRGGSESGASAQSRRLGGCPYGGQGGCAARLPRGRPPSLLPGAWMGPGTGQWTPRNQGCPQPSPPAPRGLAVWRRPWESASAPAPHASSQEMQRGNLDCAATPLAALEGRCPHPEQLLQSDAEKARQGKARQTCRAAPQPPLLRFQSQSPAAGSEAAAPSRAGKRKTTVQAAARH